MSSKKSLSSGSQTATSAPGNSNAKDSSVLQTNQQTKDHAASKSDQNPRQMADQDRNTVSHQMNGTCFPAINNPVRVSDIRFRHNFTGKECRMTYILSPELLQIYNNNKEDLRSSLAQKVATYGFTLLDAGEPRTATLAELVEQQRSLEQMAEQERKKYTKNAKKVKKGNTHHRPMSSYSNAEEAIADTNCMVLAARESAKENFEPVEPVVVMCALYEERTEENAKIGVKQLLKEDPAFRSYLLELTERTERNRGHFNQFCAETNIYLLRPIPDMEVCTAFGISEYEYLMRALQLYDFIASQALEACIFAQWPDRDSPVFRISEEEFLPWIAEVEAAQSKT